MKPKKKSAKRSGQFDPMESGRTGTLLDLVPVLGFHHGATRRKLMFSAEPPSPASSKPETLVSLLSLVEVPITTRDLVRLSAEQLHEVEEWAALVHLKASDNPVKVPPKPKLVELWEARRVRHQLRMNFRKAEVKGEVACVHCGCTESRACMTAKGPCHWRSQKPPVCSACKGKKLPRLSLAGLKLELWDEVIRLDEHAKGCRDKAERAKRKKQMATTKEWQRFARIYEMCRDRLTCIIAHGAPF
jgi:hypothetical protein